MTTAGPNNVWNERAETRPRRKNLSRPWYSFGFELFQEQISDPKDKKVLDVGCGVGEFMQILKEQGFTVAGIDGNAEQIELIKTSGLDAQTADLEKALPFQNDTFDAIVCMEVIEHVACTKSLLKEIHRILKKDGIFLVTTPNFSFLNNRLHYLFGSAPVNEGIHLRFFTRRLLRSLLRDSGFEIISQNSYGPIPLLSTVMTRILKKQPPLWRVSDELEGLLAYDFVYLVRKV